MFKCEICKRVTKPREKQYKHILKTRSKNYYYINKYGKERTSKGNEIVKEISVCEKCFQKLNDK